MPSYLRVILLILVVVAASAGFLWWYQNRPPEVTVVAVDRGTAVDAIYATGTVEPLHWAKIASTETGRIVGYPAVEGRKVARGKVLVRLDDTEVRAALDQLEAQVAFLESDAERYGRLVERQNVSRQTYDRIRSELRQARALAAVARRRVQDLTITSPLDGVVIRKDGELGEVVQAGDVLLWVGQDRPYWITADVDEEDILRVEVGQSALVSADAFPGEVLSGSIAEITPMGDPIDKQYRVRVLLPVESPLMIGMTTEVNIIARVDEEALLVPEGALLDGTVWVVAEGRAWRRKVRVGVYAEDRVEILEGLEEGEMVILAPPPRLRDGAPVSVRKDERAPAMSGTAPRESGKP